MKRIFEINLRFRLRCHRTLGSRPCCRAVDYGWNQRVCSDVLLIAFEVFAIKWHVFRRLFRISEGCDAL